MIDAAAKGSKEDRERFAEFYLPAVSAYLKARWQSSPRLHSLDDAIQEIFVECFREGGPLTRADRERPGGFRPFLFGIARNVARRFESRQHATSKNASGEVDLDALPVDETTLSIQFDRAWARSIMKRAARLQAERADEHEDAGARRRVELLRLRFREGLPIREIAKSWNEDASKVHREYARARQEFKDALRDVLAFDHPGAPELVERECALLLEILG